MEGPLFYVDALLNRQQYVKTLVDSGCGSYALVSARFAGRAKLPRVPLSQARDIEGVIDGING